MGSMRAGDNFNLVLFDLYFIIFILFSHATGLELSHWQDRSVWGNVLSTRLSKQVSKPWKLSFLQNLHPIELFFCVEFFMYDTKLIKPVSAILAVLLSRYIGAALKKLCVTLLYKHSIW